MTEALARLIAWPALDAGMIVRFADPARDLFASYLWFDLVAKHAAPASAEAGCIIAGEAVLPVWSVRGQVRSGLSSPYSLCYTPELGVDPRGFGALFARLARGSGTVRLDALDPGQPDLDFMIDGIRRGGMIVQRFDHFGDWQAPVDTDGFDAWLAARPGSLRSTVGRKLKRARDSTDFILISNQAGLEAGIAAFERVYAGSWKEAEPFPSFNAACMRALAGAGLLRLGILSTAAGPIAAQYWAISGGSAMLLKLAHDETQRALSPGTVLTALMLRAILSQDRPARLDFGRGDDPYKRLWVDQRHQRIGALLINPRHPAGVAALARSGLGAVRQRLRVAGFGIRRAKHPALCV